ncbi:MAG: SCP2 sterol-binding domain-containing protein [Defluviitaleaceae bacterium]|nr:SCP2 sterol-binding domain-containing protein [Defluviitaleaceae bacterium]
MKIIIIYGNMAHYDHGLGQVTARVKGIFDELDATCESVDLGQLHPPYYDGETTKSIDDIVAKIRAADGVIFACTAQMFAPTALLQSFLEYLEHEEYADALAGKRCMSVAVSRAGGEKSALDYLARVTGFAGGFVAAQIGLTAQHLADFDGEPGEILDKTVEDFWRAVKQERKFLIPTDFAASEALEIPGKIPERVAPAYTPDVPDFAPAEKLQLQKFSSVQEQEVDELANLFSQKHSGGAIAKEPIVENDKHNALSAPTRSALPPAPIIQAPPPDSAEGLTHNLPQKFQAHLSGGLQATLQISIKGSEKFDGFLHIHSTECTYSPGGVAPSPDITIMADSSVWRDVLTGKTTAQKAFMIGGIKVRGDFVLLTKFDMLFNFGL